MVLHTLFNYVYGIDAKFFLHSFLCRFFCLTLLMCFCLSYLPVVDSLFLFLLLVLFSRSKFIVLNEISFLIHFLGIQIFCLTWHYFFCLYLIFWLVVLVLFCMLQSFISLMFSCVYYIFCLYLWLFCSYLYYFFS